MPDQNKATKVGRLASRMELLEAQLALERQHRLMLTGVVERGLASSLNVLRFSGSLIERLIEGGLEEINRDDAVRWLNSMQDDVERAWVEARLLSDSAIAQHSALQQVQAVGDEGSRRLLAKGVAAGDLGVLPRDSLLRAMDAITRRLESPRDSSEG